MLTAIGTEQRTDPPTSRMDRGRQVQDNKAGTARMKPGHQPGTEGVAHTRRSSQSSRGKKTRQMVDERDHGLGGSLGKILAQPALCQRRCPKDWQRGKGNGAKEPRPAR